MVNWPYLILGLKRHCGLIIKLIQRALQKSQFPANPRDLSFEMFVVIPTSGSVTLDFKKNVFFLTQRPLN